MPSAWITHVKKYATEHKISYSQALKKADQEHAVACAEQG